MRIQSAWCYSAEDSADRGGMRSCKGVGEFVRELYSLEVRQAAWHPASPEHMVVLTSDNRLRYARGVRSRISIVDALSFVPLYMSLVA